MDQSAQFTAWARLRKGETVATVNRPLVSKYGTIWARNRQNIRRLRAEGRLWGVYVLCDGSMPVYIGRGRLAPRIDRHQRSKSRGPFLDHFSWDAISYRRVQADA